MNKSSFIAVGAALIVVILGVVLLQNQDQTVTDTAAAPTVAPHQVTEAAPPSTPPPSTPKPSAPEVDWTVPGASSSPLTDLNDMMAERSLGSATASVVMVDYSSLTCPHCARFHNTTLPFIKRDYVDTGKVRFVYQDFPLDGMAAGASMLARCAPPKQYFKILGMLFHEQKSWTSASNPIDALSGLVSLAGLNRTNADACLKNEGLFKGIKARADSDGAKYAIKSTPSFVINGVTHSGALSYEEFSAILDAAIAAAI